MQQVRQNQDKLHVQAPAPARARHHATRQQAAACGIASYGHIGGDCLRLLILNMCAVEACFENMAISAGVAVAV